MKKLFLLIIAVLTLTGCYDYQELNDLAIASAIGIDYIDEKYVVTVQIMNLEKSGEKENQSSALFKTEGNSIAEALKNFSISYPKQLYIGHIELMVMGKELINKDIEPVLEYFLRDPDQILEFYVIASDTNTAYEILNQKDETEDFASKGLVSSIETSSKQNGTITPVEFEELISLYLQKGINPVISNIYLEKKEVDKNEEKNALDIYNTIHLNNLLVLNDNKLYKKLTKKESIAYNIINNNLENIMIPSKYKDNDLVVRLTDIKTKLELKINNNKLNTEIKVQATGEIVDISKETFNKNDEFLNQISKIMSKEINTYITDIFDFCKNENIDILGLKQQIYQKYNKDYKKYKDKNIYSLTTKNIDSNIKVYNSGNTYYSVDRRKK